MRPERRAHRRVTGDLDVPADLLGHPGRRPRGPAPPGAAAAALVGLAAGERPKYADRRDRQHPDDQDDGYEPATRRARGRPAGRAEPAGAGPRGRLDRDRGVASDGSLAVRWRLACGRRLGGGPEPLGDLVLGDRPGVGGARPGGGGRLGHGRGARTSAAGGSARRRRLGGKAVTGRSRRGWPGRPGTGLVASLPGASSCLVAAPERSAVTAARMRCRSSSESTGEDDGADTDGPDRAAPLTRCGSSLPGSSSAMRVRPPVRYAYRAMRPHGIAEHRMGGYSSGNYEM